jgi:hypothetical protein
MSGVQEVERGNAMMILAGQSNRIWHYWAGRYPGSVGVLIGPSYMKKVPIDKWMPFVLDNDAFIAWKNKTPWSVEAWREMLAFIRLKRVVPLWAAVPDVVANREATIENWPIYRDEIKSLGWRAAFCVQDGMTPDDVPADADVVFVGGSDRWKFPNLQMWTRNFPRVHCARVTSQEMIEACEREGCESIDGTGWFRAPDRPDHFPMLERFIEGHRNPTPEFSFLTASPSAK